MAETNTSGGISMQDTCIYMPLARGSEGNLQSHLCPHKVQYERVPVFEGVQIICTTRVSVPDSCLWIGVSCMTAHHTSLSGPVSTSTYNLQDLERLRSASGRLLVVQPAQSGICVSERTQPSTCSTWIPTLHTMIPSPGPCERTLSHTRIRLRKLLLATILCARAGTSMTWRPWRCTHSQHMTRGRTSTCREPPVRSAYLRSPVRSLPSQSLPSCKAFLAQPEWLFSLRASHHRRQPSAGRRVMYTPGHYMLSDWVHAGPGQPYAGRSWSALHCVACLAIHDILTACVHGWQLALMELLSWRDAAEQISIQNPLACT